MLTWFSRCVCLMLGLCDCGLHSGGQSFDCVCRVQRGIDRGEQSQQIYQQMGGKVFTLAFYMLSLTFIHLSFISFANLIPCTFLSALGGNRLPTCSPYIPPSYLPAANSPTCISFISVLFLFQYIFYYQNISSLKLNLHVFFLL